MAKAEGDATSSSSSSSTVFIDTNLDTHLAMIVSHSDTVFNLKQKIMYEHPKCFPNCGDIIINALKVKRKGSFYHLSDSMLVKSAFEGAKKCWFLSVDASSLKQPNENRMPNKPEAENELALIPCQDTNQSYRQQADSSSNQIMYICYPGNRFSEVQKQLETEVKKVAFDSCSQVFSDCNGRVDYTREKLEQLRERQVVLETHVKQKEGDSRVGLIDDLIYNPRESSVRSESGVNKRCKSKKKGKTAASNYTVKEADIGIDEHSSGKTVTEVPKDTELEKINGCDMVSEVNTDRKDDNTEGLDGKKFNKPLEESRRSGTISNKNRKSKKMTDVAISNFTVKNDNVDISAYSSGKTDKEVPVHVEMVNTDIAKGNMEVSRVDDNDLRPTTGEFLGTHVKTREDVAESQVSDAQGNIKLRTASKERKRRRGKNYNNLPEEAKNEIAMINSVVPESSVMIDAAKGNTEVNTLDDNGPRLNTGEFLETSVGIRDDVAENLVSDAQGSTELEKASKKRKRSRDKRDSNVREETKSEIAAPDIGPESGYKGSKKIKKRQSSKVVEVLPPTVAKSGNLRDDIVLSSDQDVARDVQDVKIDGAKELVSSDERHIETDNASKIEIKRKMDKMISENQSCVNNLEPNKNIGNGLGSLTLASDSTQAPSSCSSDAHETSFGNVLSNQNLGDANSQQSNTKRKVDRNEFLGCFSQIMSDREAPKVKPIVNSIKMLKSSDVAVKAKKKTEGKLSLDNNHSTAVKSSGKGKVDIFKKNLGGSSENRAKKAPSTILSSSSDEEEEEDEAVQDSARNGEAKNGRSHKETGTPSIGVILRNTSTFKKVRLAASRTRIEDMESKEVDVVPESQPF